MKEYTVNQIEPDEILFFASGFMQYGSLPEASIQEGEYMKGGCVNEHARRKTGC